MSNTKEKSRPERKNIRKEHENVHITCVHVDYILVLSFSLIIIKVLLLFEDKVVRFGWLVVLKPSNRQAFEALPRHSGHNTKCATLYFFPYILCNLFSV